MTRSSLRVRALLLAGAVSLLGACGDDDPAIESPATTGRRDTATTTEASPTTTAARTAVEVRVTVSGGRVREGGGRVKVPLGDEVHLVVRSDVADEVHVHGYDRVFAVTAGGEGSVTFVADLPGVWEVELHERGLTLVQLEVA